MSVKALHHQQSLETSSQSYNTTMLITESLRIKMALSKSRPKSNQ